MIKQNIQSQIKDLESKKEDIDKQINSLKLQLNTESNNAEWISLDQEYEVTKDVLFKGKNYKEIMQLKKSNEELLTLKQIAIILEDKELTKELKMDSKYSTSDDFFFKQPFETNEKNGYVARFYSGSNRSYFDLFVNSVDSVSSLGVRFVRKKVKKV